MADTRSVHDKDVTIGDVAVNGLLGGILAGAAMLVYLLVALGLGGESLSTVLLRFGPADGAASPLFGAVDHLAVSGIYGMVFALIWHWITQRSNRHGLALVAGLIYSVCCLPRQVAPAARDWLTAAGNPTAFWHRPSDIRGYTRPACLARMKK